jgi:hypothetical protein
VNSNALLKQLTAASVEFVVVGGLAATIHGSAYVTRDADICIPFEPGNIARVLQALSPTADRGAGTSRCSLGRCRAIFADPVPRVSKIGANQQVVSERHVAEALDWRRSLPPLGRGDGSRPAEGR